jgi:hypothetical protein
MGLTRTTAKPEKPFEQSMLGRWVPGSMLIGSVTVTLNSPDVGPRTRCIGICLESPITEPNSVAEVAFAPQSTSNVVAVPGVDGLGETVILGLCEAAAGAALAKIRPTSSAPHAQGAASAELTKRTAPPGSHARTLGYTGFPFAACCKLTATLAR